MRRLLLWGVVLTALHTVSAAAQDSTPPGPRAPALRRLIEERFAARIQEQLGLTDDQMTRLRATTTKFGAQRRELERRQVAFRRALAMQLRPGTAADKDSVARLTEGFVAGRVAYARTFEAELGELRAYLDPVQRAQLFVMRERLLRRAREFQERQGEGGGGMRRRRPLMDR